MNITAADVNKLRQITGAGMMDCKKALVPKRMEISILPLTSFARKVKK
jgi:translation elongation factor EF-Ts